MVKKKMGQPVENDEAGLPAEISRRDFVNGTLVGFGAALLSSAAPGATSSHKFAGVFKDPWTGYGGTGDYAISNGNVASVREAAHLIRDGATSTPLQDAVDTGEEYDMVIVGGGFSGIGAAYQFYKKYGNTKKCLILENHPVFGGEAKQNEFEVDGYTLYGPQASNDFAPPQKESDDLIANIYRDTGLPFEFSFTKHDPKKTSVKAPLENFYGMFWEEERYDTGYFFGADAATPWVVNPRKDNLARMPWPETFKVELNRAFADKEDYHGDEGLDRWLDSMSYKDLLEKVMGYSPLVTNYFDPVIAISMGGVCSDVYSAYSAKLLDMPGTQVHYTYDIETESAYSFPGGNAGIYRHITKYLIPDSIQGSPTLEDVLYNPINFSALDKPGNPVSIRLNSTAIDVRHAGPAENSSHVDVCYLQDGKIKKIKAKTVVMSIGGWVARNIVSDMPPPLIEAYSHFYHSPVLVVNVALRHWRFLNKLGISSGRLFKGFGDFFSIRRPMITGKSIQPFDPDKPTVMTFYVPFTKPGHPIAEQGALGRAELLGKSYDQYEQEITQQMTDMFSAYGFDAQRDIAGIVLNRWGHAYISPQPGFHFGKEGKPAPREVVKKGFGRIQFGHSELSGYMSHTRALNEGARASDDAMAHLTPT
ncbi:MAG: NAD(P)/FAD-dependent oxidoreductase [Halieaceae bacterium]|jgi:spermidine dehydrogenase|nr:NAD(P)/FAD-dependent oxidoreductase [Halieaceae bacterium]